MVEWCEVQPARTNSKLWGNPVQCVETIEGDILQFIKDRIAAKDYVDITMAATLNPNLPGLTL